MMFPEYPIEVFPGVCREGLPGDFVPVCDFRESSFEQEGIRGRYKIAGTGPEPANVRKVRRNMLLAGFFEVFCEVSTFFHVPGDEIARKKVNHHHFLVFFALCTCDSDPRFRQEGMNFSTDREAEEKVEMGSAAILELENPEIGDMGEFSTDSTQEVVHVLFCLSSSGRHYGCPVTRAELGNQQREAV